MPYAVTTGEGHVTRLDDVPLEDLHAIAERHKLDSWFHLLATPLKHGAAAIDLFKYCCEQHGDKIPTPITPKVLAPAFEWVPDDLPDTFEDGLPKAEDGTSTSGSSGAPSDSTGPLTSPDDSPSET